MDNQIFNEVSPTSFHKKEEEVKLNIDNIDSTLKKILPNDYYDNFYKGRVEQINKRDFNILYKIIDTIILHIDKLFDDLEESNKTNNTILNYNKRIITNNLASLKEIINLSDVNNIETIYNILGNTLQYVYETTK